MSVKYPPVIVIGMHRSGTGLITQLLEGAGLFTGQRKQGDFEAIFFLKLNQWMLHQSGSEWDTPLNNHFLLENPAASALTDDYLHFMLSTPQVINYMGLPNYLRYRSPENFDRPWGWKDPRNTFTLPIWMDLFPNAKVIHIYRHGLDVAQSIMVRMYKVLEKVKADHEKWGKRFRVYWVYERQSGFVDSLRCASSIEEGFALWEEYMREARSHVQRLGNQAIEVKYEDFLANPKQVIQTLSDFCELPVRDGVIQKLAGSVNKSRAFAFQSSPDLQQTADHLGARLAEWGY